METPFRRPHFDSFLSEEFILKFYGKCMDFKQKIFWAKLECIIKTSVLMIMMMSIKQLLLFEMHIVEIIVNLGF